MEGEVGKVRSKTGTKTGKQTDVNVSFKKQILRG